MRSIGFANVTAALLLSSAAARANVAISTDPTQNMTCSGGACSPTASDAVLNVNDLANMLAAGDTKVTTGSGAVNIEVLAALAWSSTSRLTLDANTGLNIQAPITVAGSGALTLTYNDGGSNGDLIFSNGGNATFANLSSSLVINGSSYTLVANIQTLASEVKHHRSDHFGLANDSDASAAGTYKGAPIRGQFKGVFEGLGHSISNLSIEADSQVQYIGLFETMPFTGIGALRDVSLSNAQVTGGDFAGALVGDSAGVISHVFVTGSVNSRVAGGIAGGNSGTIIDSGADAAVTGGPSSYVGGLVGSSTAGIAKITRSFAKGAVSGGLAGGLAGQSGGTIEMSYATGPVSGDTKATVAGLVGANVYGSRVVDCYSSGDVTGGQKARVGGLIGSSYKEFTDGIETSYSIGKTSGGVDSLVGGLAVSVNPKRVINNYWDTSTSGATVGVAKRCREKCQNNVVGLTDTQLKSGLPAGFDPKVWGQSPGINNGYPYLLANPPPK